MTNVVVAFGQDCDPLKPNKPLDSLIENDTKANASAFFKSVGAADFGNKFAKAQQDTLSKYPHADWIEIAEFHIYFLCTFLNSSESLSEDQKLDKILDLIKIQESGFSPQEISGVAPQLTTSEAPSDSKVSSNSAGHDSVQEAVMQANDAQEHVESLAIVGVHDKRIEQGVADAKAAYERAVALASVPVEPHQAALNEEAVSDAKAAYDRAEAIAEKIRGRKLNNMPPGVTEEETE